MIKAQHLSCNHPLFAWASKGEWNEAPEGLSRPCVFVFERRRWREPTQEQIAKYRKAERIVKKLGGSMDCQEWQLAGEAKLLSSEEVEEILAAVLRDNPGATVIAHWNGAGCYTVSVGVDLGPANA